MQEIDVAIIGGGLVGACCARALAVLGLTVVVFDKQAATSSYSPELDNRGLAVSYTSAQILNDLELWSKIANHAFPIRTVHVSEQHSFGFTKLEAAAFNIPALGYVVSASVLGTVLIKDLDAVGNIKVLRPIEIKAMHFDLATKNWMITAGEFKLRAKLLIAADGSNSMLAAHFNIPYFSKEYNQSAIVANLSVINTSLDTAFERFTQQGVMAFLPFGAEKIKFVWTAATDNLAELQALSDAEFLQRIQTAIGFRLGKFRSIDKRLTFPIKYYQASAVHAQSAVLIGNAANTLHPVAAQGFNLGLRDVATLAKMLAVAQKNGNAINDAKMLFEFAQQRKPDHAATQKYTNSIVEIFANQSALMTVSRRLSLLVAQFIPSINKRIIRQGLGK